MIWVLLIILAVTFMVYKLNASQKQWEKRGVKQAKETFLLGSFGDLLLRKKSFYDIVLDLYNEFPNERYSGSVQFFQSILLLRDPKLIKQIGVKDFDHFIDHVSFIGENVDPLWNKNLFALKGEKWHEMRATLSPSFTSSKMKMMFSLICECAENFITHFEKKVNPSSVLEIDVKDGITRFTNDVIATAAFGIKCDSLKDRDNEFLTNSRKLLTFSGLKNMFKFIILQYFPKLARLTGTKLFPSAVSNFFIKIVTETIRTREENKIYRPDMINLLMEARKGKDRQDDQQDLVDTGFATVKESGVHLNRKVMKSELTDIDITAQGMIFFLAGFETVSVLMCFMCHELALHPDIQERLQKEVDDTREECGGKATYEALMKMKYMDMVISETLRLWPPAVSLDRECVKPYVIEPEKSGEKPVHLKKGDNVWFPVIGIHRDEKYYPNPDVFDPERFSDENKNNIDPYTYMPFGVGPRNCIGSRFALLETKIIFYHLLLKFSLVKTAKTSTTIKFKTAATDLIPEDGFWVGLKLRS